MTIKIAIAVETAEGERRVAIEPGIVKKLADQGAEILMLEGSADIAGFNQADFDQVSWVNKTKDLYQNADVVFSVQMPDSKTIAMLPSSAVLIGTLTPYKNPDLVQALNKKKITSFAMELIPRISRAQSMDVLSSQAAVAGYKAAIMAADRIPRFLPMLTTAAGTIRPSKVIVIGAGVAGLQAIATAKRLGAIVLGYDVRSATKEQVESLGGKFIELDITAEGEGGYARELTNEEKQQQQEQLAEYISQADALITTAAVPGRPAPKIIPVSTVEGMKKGSVIIDLAAEGGGNCELTEAGKTIDHNGVTIHAPLNVPSQVPFHASEMYARNLFNFLSPMLNEGALEWDWEDEIISGSLLTKDGEIANEAVNNALSGENKS